MICEEKVLLETINSYIHKKELPTIENWDKVFYVAKKHSLGSMFYIAVKNLENLPQKFQEKAEQHFVSQVSQQISQDYYAEKLFADFNELGIKYMPLKGKRIRELYPDPAARTSCDVDVFYDKSKTKQVNKVLTDYEFKSQGNGVNHSSWQKGVVTFEMHYELAAHKEKAYEYYKDVWQKLELTNGSMYKFSDEDFYIYFIVHSAKHFYGGGFGIRTVLDVYFYKNNVKMNEEYLTAEFKKLGLTKFVTCIEKLANAWFGGVNADEDTEFLGNYILRASTYGTSANGAAMVGVNGKKGRKRAKTAYLLRALFPKYKTMKTIYPILKPLPFLLPFMWVYKWFEVLILRNKKIKNTVNNIKAMDDDKVKDTVKLKELTGFTEY